MEFVEANVVKDPSSENATIVCQDCTYPNEIVLKILGRIIFQKPDRQNYKTESEYEEAVRTAYSCPRCEREFEMSEEKKEKPEAEITELTDELREELGQYSNERPHPAPKILTKDQPSCSGQALAKQKKSRRTWAQQKASSRPSHCRANFLYTT